MRLKLMLTLFAQYSWQVDVLDIILFLQPSGTWVK